MLINVRTLLLGVTFVANGIAGGIGAQLFGPKRSMGIVAIVALDQAFVNAVVKRPGELRAYVSVAAVAERWRIAL